MYYTCDLAFRFVDCFRFGFQSIINYHRFSFCMISSLQRIELLFPWDIHTHKGKYHLSTYVGESWRSHRVDPQRKFLLTTLLHLDGSRLQIWCSSRNMTLGGHFCCARKTRGPRASQVMHMSHDHRAVVVYPLSLFMACFLTRVVGFDFLHDSNGRKRGAKMPLIAINRHMHGWDLHHTTAIYVHTESVES
jgi:hypothetical protein